MSTPLNAVESVMAEIWESVLHVRDVGPDDDFFALGGDSLLAIQIISAAEQRGLPLKLVDLFKRSDLRGSCRNLTAEAGGGTAPAAELLEQADRDRLPARVSAAYPMTRLQLGLIYESAASGGSLYVDVVSREILLLLDVEVLRQALDHVVRRHPILRTRFDLGGYSEPLQLVEKQATVELELDDLRELSDEEVTARRSATMEKLGRPFDLDGVPLIRAHAAPSGPERFRLTYAFHHAILDGWSESVLALELITTYQAMLRRVTDAVAPAGLGIITSKCAARAHLWQILIYPALALANKVEQLDDLLRLLLRQHHRGRVPRTTVRQHQIKVHHRHHLIRRCRHGGSQQRPAGLALSRRHVEHHTPCGSHTATLADAFAEVTSCWSAVLGLNQ